MITTNPAKKCYTFKESEDIYYFHKSPQIRPYLPSVTFILRPPLLISLRAILFLPYLRLDYIHGPLRVPGKNLFLNQIAYMPPLLFIRVSLLKSLHRMTSRALERSPNELASRINPGRAAEVLDACWLPRLSRELHLIRMHRSIQLIGSRQGADINW
jgi:hypothetical protein